MEVGWDCIDKDSVENIVQYLVNIVVDSTAAVENTEELFGC